MPEAAYVRLGSQQSRSFFDRNQNKLFSWLSIFALTEKRHLYFLFLTLFITMVSSMLHPIATILCGNIFGALAMRGAGIIGSSQMLQDIYSWCFWLTALGGLAWVIESCFMFAWIKFGEHQAKEARIRLFIALLNKKIKWYDLQENGSRAFLTRLETQIRELQLGVSQPMGFIVYEIFGAFVSLGVGFYYSWQLSLLMLANFPLMVAASWLVSKKLGPAIERQKMYLTKASKHSSIAFRAINTVKAFNGQDYAKSQYAQSLKLVTKNYLIQAKINASQAAMLKFMMVLVYLEGFWFGLHLVTNGDYSGDIITAFYTSLAISQAAEIVLPQWMVIAKGSSASQALSKILPRINDNSIAKRKSGGKISSEIEANEIEFKEVSFCYPANPNNLALNHVNMCFPAGKTTYIVGKSGSGKSTVGNLIMNYYKSTEGMILINGKPIQLFYDEWLRKNITMMDQITFLFDETILQNIAFGSTYPPCNENIIHAIKTADLESTLKYLPNALDTPVTFGGKSLSGGQRQKVAIARTRLRESPILILDEPVSALDSRSREKVMKEIRKWREGKTTIIITHDVSKIFNDEYVYVMANGSVAEEGFRRDLNGKNGSTFFSLLLDAQEMSEVSAAEVRNDLSSFPSTSMRVARSHSNISDRQTRNNDKEIQQSFCISTKYSEINKMSDQGTFSDPLSDHLVYGSDLEPNIKYFENSPAIVSAKGSDCFLDVKKAKANSYPPKLVTKSKSDKNSASPHTFEEYSINDDVESTLRSAKSKFLLKKTTTNPCSLYTIFSTIWPRLSCKKKNSLLYGLLACFFTAMTTPVFAYFLSNLMGVYSSPNAQFREGSRWAISLLMLAFFDGISTYYSHYYLEQTGQEWITALRKECFGNILKQPKAWMDKESNSPSRLTDCLDRNAEEMRNLLGRFLAPILSTGLMLTISIIWSLMINWRLTCVALSCGPLIYISSFAFNRTTTEYEDKCNQLAGITSSILSETVTNIRLVKSLGLEPYFQRKFRAAVASTYSMGLRRSIFSGLTYGVVGDTISFMMTALVVYYGATLIVDQSISILGYFQIINILLFALGNSFSVISLIPQINASRTTATKMIELVDLPSTQSNKTRGMHSFSLFPIVFKNLNFTYPNCANPILKNISFTILPNSCTAIIGSSGSGKSTIVSLLLGLYLPDESFVPSLTFSGASINQTNLVSLREHVAIVSQDIILFPDTIYANIIYGLPKASPYSNVDCVKDAAKQADIAEFIDSLERGYDTVIGEGGMGLSGGQIQRLAIARALIRRPALLILDEATSALDADSTAGICNTIQGLRNDSAGKFGIILITHSIQLMNIADHIILLEKGRIIERGDFRKSFGHKS